MSKARNIADLGSNDVLDTDANGLTVSGDLTVSDSFPDFIIQDVDGTNQLMKMQQVGGASMIKFRNGVNDGELYFTGEVTGNNKMKIATNGDISFYEDTGTTPKMVWDSSAESLGIGTSSIDSNAKLVVSNNGAEGLEIRANSTNIELIAYNRSAATYEPIVYNGLSHEWRNSNGNVATIDSSGNLLVGKTTTAFATAGTTITSAGSGEFTRDSVVMNLNRLSSNGQILRFYKDTTEIGGIGVDARPWFSMASATCNFGFRLDNYNATNGIFAPANASGSIADNTHGLGYSGGRWKDLYLGGGVYLGGTGAANYLDDYEEGTFTPTLEDPSSGNAVSSYYYRTGRYTKIGSVVHISITLSPANMGTLTNSTDNVHITGLPFASRGSIPNDTQVLPISSFNGGSYSYVVARLAQNSTQLEIRNIYASGGGWDYVKGNEVGAGGQQIVTATYLTDA